MFRKGIVLVCCFMSFASFGQLTGGPMLGYVTFNEAAVWVEVQTGTKLVSVQLKDSTGKVIETIKQSTDQSEFKHIPVTVRLCNLNMNSAYTATIYVNKKRAAPELSFRTPKIWEWRTEPKNFSFLFGSCAYLNDRPHDRPGPPYGQGQLIFKTMTETPSDFMLWGGDNFYYRHHDCSSESGMRYRWHHARSQDTLNRLLASRPNYAIWDDHDFGPNNAERSFQMKQTALNLFKQYWPAPAYGMPENEGIYQKFDWEDCTFLMLDNRYHRSHPDMDSASKVMLGKLQMQWLKENLLFTHATFKFITIGTQIINEDSFDEKFNDFPLEKKELMDFIALHKIKNVIFLSGDRHFTEINQDQLGDVKVWDFTCSPLASRPFFTLNTKAEFNDNTKRVGETLVYDKNNFAKIELSGTRKERKVTISCLDKQGQLLWKYEISKQ